MITKQTIETITCDRCPATIVIEGNSENPGLHTTWAEIHVYTIGGRPIIGPHNKTGGGTHICRACVGSLSDWWNSGQ